ncbi:aspartate/glutamate racemase family protein [Pseudomonadota bacterium]
MEIKTIGLIGGMSWPSTIEYYRIINEEIQTKLGKPSSAKIIIYSVNLKEIEQLSHSGDWDGLARKLIGIAQDLEKVGAKCLLISANTIHKVADKIQEAINIPLIHIADVTGEKIKENKITKVCLLGTKIVMEDSFYKDRIESKFGNIITVITPNEKEKETINNIIHQELNFNIINSESKKMLVNIIKNIIKREQIQGVIIGCTALPNLINQTDLPCLTFDTRRIHANAAVKFSLYRK